MILTGECTRFSQNKIFNVTKRLQRIERNEISNYRLYLNFTDLEPVSNNTEVCKCPPRTSKLCFNSVLLL